MKYQVSPKLADSQSVLAAYGVDYERCVLNCEALHRSPSTTNYRVWLEGE
jgi:hypothetical protein